MHYRFSGLVLAVVLACIHTASYAQDAVTIIAQDACECVDKVDYTSQDEMEIKLGLCLLEAASPHKKELKKKHGIDLDKMDSETGEKLGMLIGIQMASTCPEFFVKLSEEGHLDIGEEETTEMVFEEYTKFMNARIVSVQQEQFVTVTVREANGKEHKLLWLEYFENANELLATNSNATFVFEYEEREFYNPQFGDYMMYKVIRGMIAE